MRKNEWQDGQLNIKKVLYISIALLAFAIIAFVMASITYAGKNNEKPNVGKFDTSVVDNNDNNEEKIYIELEKIEEKNTEENKKVAVNTSKIEEKVQKQKEEEKEIKNEESNQIIKKEDPIEEKKETVATNTKPEPVQELKFIKPVEGEIITPFAKEELVFSNTLGEWVVHNGIDIKADKTTVVKSAEAGKVKYIKNDPRYGLSIVIEHRDGYKTIYSNLLSTEFVSEDENVEKGQAIGTVGTTSTFEILEDPHLHFEIMKDNKYLDPQVYIK